MAGEERIEDVIIKGRSMDDDVFADFIAVAKEAMGKSTVQKEQAEFIKRHFDEKHSPVWHCIVGKSFGSYVTHEEKCFVYVYIDGSAVLLFKAGG